MNVLLWRVATCVCESSTLNKADRKQLEAVLTQSATGIDAGKARLDKKLHPALYVR